MTSFLAYVPEAISSIWRNKARSLLSILGMVIGIASVIAVLGLSQAGTNGMKATLAAGGDPGIFAVPDPSQNDPSIATMYYRDAAFVQSQAPDELARTIPFYQRDLRLTVSGKSDFVGVDSTPALKEGNGVVVLQGRRINETDVQSGAGVAMLSKNAADKFFPAGNAVGQSLNAGSQRVAIVGVFTITGSLFNSLTGDTLYVPYTTAHRIFPGPIDGLLFWRSPQATGMDAINAARGALARLHPRAQYSIQDQSSALGIFENVLSSIGIGLTFIGGIALLVAGVGIMNIMLVSVTERTREIGIRKSIGANASAIATQFLIEALLLSLAGGAIGTGIGVAVVDAGRGVIERSVGSAPVPWLLVIGIAAVFSLVVGVVFGFYPATRAARLDPVEALRS